MIELDGSIHSQPSQALRDQTRDEYLKQRRYTVARFSNGMVLEAPEIFVEKVLGRVVPLPDVFTVER